MTDPDYFTLAQVRALPDIGTAYTDQQILDAAAFFAARVEEELQVSFAARVRTETHDGGTPHIVLGSAWVDLVSVTVSGSVVPLSSVTALSGVLTQVSRSPFAVGPVVVSYVDRRYSAPPASIRDACLWATRDRLMSQGDRAGVDVRRTSVTTDFGTTSYILPGEARPTGFPDLDAAIASYLRTTTSLGFA